MKNQRFVEIEGQQIPVTEDVYRAYKRPLWAEHKRKERERRCRDASGNRCNEDCSKCDKQRIGSDLSLDKLSEDGFELSDPVDFTGLLEDGLLLDALQAALGELDTLDRQIVALFAVGKSEREIGAAAGLSQKGINKRKARIFATLRQRLENFI